MGMAPEEVERNLYMDIGKPEYWQNRYTPQKLYELQKWYDALERRSLPKYQKEEDTPDDNYGGMFPEYEDWRKQEQL